MEVTTTKYKHCDLVKVNGRIDSVTAPKLAEVVDSIMNDGRHKIIMDMSEVEYMSSAGLRILVSTQKTCKRYNRGERVLALVPPRIYEALELVGFVKLFKFYDNTQDAIGSF